MDEDEFVLILCCPAQESFKAIEHSIMLSIDGVVKSFAQQVNPNADFFCKVAKDTFGMVMGALGKICLLGGDAGK